MWHFCKKKLRNKTIYCDLPSTISGTVIDILLFAEELSCSGDVASFKEIFLLFCIWSSRLAFLSAIVTAPLRLRSS